MSKHVNKYIELSRYQFYAVLQSIFIGLVLIYQLIWYGFGTPTMAECIVYGRQNELALSGTIQYRYWVHNRHYQSETTRNEMPITQAEISICYLRFAPSISRANNFYSVWYGFIIAYFIYFTFTTLLFFIPNDTMPANTYFYFTKKKPWINLIEK